MEVVVQEEKRKKIIKNNLNNKKELFLLLILKNLLKFWYKINLLKVNNIKFFIIENKKLIHLKFLFIFKNLFDIL